MRTRKRLMRTQCIAPALVAAALAACQPPGPPQPVKSPIDDREYRHIVLPNNLRALLIHAPGSDNAAAAASVARGSEQDPDPHEGLAHLVEHMLFRATRKYPEVDGFPDFVNEHDGSCSAYTASGRTTYHFQLKPGHFPEALDRFAQFFTAPLFEPDQVEREKQVVQREYQSKRWEHAFQRLAVGKQLLNPDHPESRFNMGNLETLSGVGVPEVRAFFEANYSANAITVAVLGPQDLDTLEALVAEQFGMVVDRGLGPRPANAPLFSPGTLPGSYAWRTFKDEKALEFTFPIPPLKPYYRTKPARYLAELVGHEGPGSLHDVLSRRDWIEALSAGRNVIDEQNSIFGISMTLTDAGESHVQEIVDLAYAWLDLIRRGGTNAWRYREIARLSDLDFRFHDQTKPVAAVIHAAEALADYPLEDVLRHSYLMEAFDEPLIRRYLGFLTPENALVSISGPDVDVGYTESIDVPAWRPGPARLPRQTDAPLELPGPNPYLPEDLELALEPQPPGKPLRLETGTAIETWHAADTEFRTPTARVDLQLGAAEPLTPDDIVMATLHAKLVEDVMHARTYAAGRAGMTHEIKPTWTGLRIYVKGFHDKLAVLFDDVLATSVDPALDAERFAVMRTKLVKTYNDHKRGETLRDTVYSLLHPAIWPLDTLLDAARRATPATLAAWRKRRLPNMGATLLVHGNVLEDDAHSLAVRTQRRLHIVELPHAFPSARRLAGSLRYQLTVEQLAVEARDETKYALYIQGASDAIEERARIALIGQMLDDRYYTAVISEQTYIARAFSVPIARHPGIMFVQWSETGAEELETRTLAFLSEQRAWFCGLSEAELEEHKNGFLATLTGVDRNNRDRMSRLTQDLAARVLTFDDRDQLVRAVRRLTPEEVANAYDALINPARGNRLTVYSPGRAGTAPQDGTLVSSMEALIESTSPDPSASQR